MKKFLFLLLLCASVASYGQLVPQTVNIMQGVNTLSSSTNPIYVYKQSATFAPTRKTNGYDTLSATDTSYLYWYSTSTLDYQVKYSNTKVTGYVRVKAKLQGCVDTTGDYNNTCNWYTLRGDRTTCFGCSDSLFQGGNASSSSVFLIKESPMTAYRLQIINDTAAAGTSYSKVNLLFKK